ncbi:MAG TPA: matrixin family metalloprotease [Gammaproteobacteria bacterium]|nr:matrixin family metalloprotease [Gammaproteobacteria bacterium]
MIPAGPRCRWALGLLLAAAAPAATAACNGPLAYAVGDVDPRFGISRAAFQRAVADAARLWEAAAGRDLFERRPDADFRINLEYSEHQRTTERARDLDRSAASLGKKVDRARRRLEALRDRLHRRLRQWRHRLRALQADRRALNERVRTLNEQGGASPRQAAELRDRRKELQRRASELQAGRDGMERLQGRVNELAVRANALVLRHNRQVRERDRLAGGGKKFHQGYYQRGGAAGRNITIRQFSNRDRLRFALAHELGHALGMGHVEAPRAVMHAVYGRGPHPRLSLTDADRRALEGVCGNG